LTYFRHILPAIGRLVSRHSAAYGYLPDSVGAFATPTQLMSTLQASGFVDVAAVRMTCGIVFLYTARRGD
jgi:demethylmenaquinone methyltransferase/2-methoxy-6-polyprenyl-1,4-benzoquinol methylase